jgi:hypothetical protein
MKKRVTRVTKSYEVEDIKGKELKREKNRLEGYDP